MKKILVLLSTVVMLGMMGLVSAPPASAYGNSCNTYTSDNGNMKVEICVSLSAPGSGNGYVWGHATFDNVPGYSLPYALDSFGGLGMAVWSSAHNGGPNYCEGRYSSCNGGGDANWLIINPVNSATPYVKETDHYFSKLELHCYTHAEIAPSISWTQNQYNNGVYDHHDWNTNGGDVSLEFCVDP